MTTAALLYREGGRQGRGGTEGLLFHLVHTGVLGAFYHEDCSCSPERREPPGPMPDLSTPLQADSPTPNSPHSPAPKPEKWTI